MSNPFIPKVATTVSTNAELNALPMRSVILSEGQEAWQKVHDGEWAMADADSRISSFELTCHGDTYTVLYVAR